MLAIIDLALLIIGLLIALCRTTKDGVIVLAAFTFSSFLAVTLDAYEMGANWHILHGAIILLAAYNTKEFAIISLYAVSAVANLFIYIDIWLDSIPLIYDAYSYIIWGVFLLQMGLCNAFRGDRMRYTDAKLGCDFLRGDKA